MTNWQTTRLGEILCRSTATGEIQPDESYKEITVKLWGKGVVLRGVISGSEFNGSRRFLAREGQLILSRIDARNGAIGIVPKSLDGSLVSSDFPLFALDKNRALPGYFEWLSKTSRFIELCQRASEGTTNRVRLQEDRFLNLQIPIPPLPEQGRIVARIEELAAKIRDVRSLREQQHWEVRQLLLSAFWKVSRTAPRMPMGDIAPLVRRSVDVDVVASYPELGIRSFGNGTFHKPPLSGSEVGTKRIFKIEPDDLVFSNVFAWEGAIAVAEKEDAGRFGSHRFITCVPKKQYATSNFLCFYFLTEEGLELIRAASPGGAGRNRTLGLESLANITVPVPSLDAQAWFDLLQSRMTKMRKIQVAAAIEINALLPSILDRAFRGEL
jgi:type I restriction enzyme S subunit